MLPFLVPDDFRAFLQEVVGYLDGPAPDKLLDAEDAFHHECGYGGRVEGLDAERASVFAFTYLTGDGQAKWEVTLDEPALREIADGLLIEVPAERVDLVRTRHRTPAGDALLIWGEYPDDALAITSEHQLYGALDGLHLAAHDEPRLVRMWSATDDQLVAVLVKDECALYVVESVEGYATSCGDPSRTDATTVVDPEDRPLTAAGADFVPWTFAREAFVTFLERGDLGPHVRVEGRIPTSLLMMGEVDRKAALASRAEVPRTVERTSVPRLATPIPISHVLDEATTPHELETHLGPEALVRWAKQLVAALVERELLELPKVPKLDEVYYQLGTLLQTHALEAESSLDTADWLANEIGALRGIGRLFASGGDLQLLLPRSRAG